MFTLDTPHVNGRGSEGEYIEWKTVRYLMCLFPGVLAVEMGESVHASQ